MEAGHYLRQSEDRDGEQLAVTRQREDGRKLAELREWTIAAEYVDNDVTASGKKRRPAFEELIRDLTAGKLGAVIAWDLTRLTRNARDRLRLIEACEAHGTTIALVRGADIDPGTPTGRMIAGILGEVAEHEIRQKGDRQARQARQAMEAGLPTGGRRPFGYENDKVTIREAEAAALRKAYDSVLHGVPVARAARELNAAGLGTPQLTRSGEKSWWTAQTLGQTLLNPRYCGLRAVTVRPEHGKPTWDIRGPAAWKPIIAEETWRAVTAILSDPDRRRPGKASRALLTGVALCGVEGCGSTVHRGANPQQQPTYRCRASLGHVVRRSEPVDEYIGALVVERLSRRDAVDLLIDMNRPDVPGLRTELGTLQARLDELAVAFADGELTPGQLRAATARLRARVSEVEAVLADAGRVNVLGPLIHAEDVRAAWEALDTDRQRTIVDTLMTVWLMPPGRGTRTFRPETVPTKWRTT